MTKFRLPTDQLTSIYRELGVTSKNQSTRERTIFRFQARDLASAGIQKGEITQLHFHSTRGMGIQVFRADGGTGFATLDHWGEAKLVKRRWQAARQLARQSPTGKKNKSDPGPLGPDFFRKKGKLQKSRHISEPVSANPYPILNKIRQKGLLPALLRRLEDQVHRQIRQVARETGQSSEDFTHHVRIGISLDNWRIWDTTGMDHTTFFARISIFTNLQFENPETKKRQSANVQKLIFDPALLSPGPDQLKMPDETTWRADLRQKLRLLVELSQAGECPPSRGKIPVIIDYKLAKGLAHEALGHALESDASSFSILGDQQEKLEVGRQIAAERVKVVDGPLEGDNAWQPVSANGMPRQLVTLVVDGKVQAGLADLFSAGKAGVPVSGAGRSESCFHIPLPRMTNIRLEVQDAAPLPAAWKRRKDISPDKISPADLQKWLKKQQLFEHNPVWYLMRGYKGGQVNIREGDFVFNCEAVYRITPGEITLFRPAPFTGKTIETLKHIAWGLGPLKTDAAGTCGKQGQQVPSSGGSHYFLGISASPAIRVGG